MDAASKNTANKDKKSILAVSKYDGLIFFGIKK